jgi:hypothetical protein
LSKNKRPEVPAGQQVSDRAEVVPLTSDDDHSYDTSGVGWYVSDSHALRAIGYLTAAIPELHNVDVPFVAEKWAEALTNTIEPSDPSPIGPESVRQGHKCPLCFHEWTRHDPEDGKCDAHSDEPGIIGPCRCGRSKGFWRWRNQLNSRSRLVIFGTTPSDASKTPKS